ncbi:MAG: hypothetical protein ACD_72C00101G0002 [uncultured bacterium]|nr:MAG: hypothetical protein ACD_72C00101G0002 [uncultured bacterium]
MEKRNFAVGFLVAVFSLSLLVATPTLAASEEEIECKQMASEDYKNELKTLLANQKSDVVEAKTVFNNAKKNYNSSLKTEFANYKQDLKNCKTSTTTVSVCNKNSRTKYLLAVKKAKTQLNVDTKTYTAAIKQASADYANGKKEALLNYNQTKQDCADLQNLVDQVDVDQIDDSLLDAFSTPTDDTSTPVRQVTTVPKSTSDLPTVGWNPVNVNSCTQVGDNIVISNAVNNGAPYTLTTACRDAGNGGPKFYTMQCLTNTQYRVDWRPCTSRELSGTTPVVVPVTPVVPAAPVATCSETDNGLVYDAFGITTGNDEVTGKYGSYSDSCGAYIGGSGQTSGPYIAEKHCSSWGSKIYVHTQWYNCPNGCANGVCLTKKVVVAPVVTTPAPFTTCSETDNGIDNNVFGQATGSDENTGTYGTYQDSCGAYVGDSGKLDGAYIAEKHCSTFGAKTYVHTQWQQCENGCAAGACLAKKVVAESCYKNPLQITLSDLTPLAKNVIPGQTNIELARVKFTNTNCADVRINQTYVNFSGQNPNPNLLVSNLKLAIVDGSTKTFIGNTIVEASANNLFWQSFVIPANQSKELAVYSDISSNATLGWFKTGVGPVDLTNIVTGADSFINSQNYGNSMTVIYPR